jgi:hypothetical protein
MVLPEVLTPEIVLNALNGKATVNNNTIYILIGAGILVVLFILVIYLGRNQKRI